MQAVDIVIDHAVPRSFRVASLESVFDCPIKDKQRLEWHTEIPDLTDEWSIGLIVGPSGSGKTTIAKHVYGEPLQWTWPRDKALIDALAPNKDMTEVSTALGAVGLNTIPSWARPFHVLSNGEQFRATIARHFLEDERDPIVIDEFKGVETKTIYHPIHHKPMTVFAVKLGRVLHTEHCDKLVSDKQLMIAMEIPSETRG